MRFGQLIDAVLDPPFAAINLSYIALVAAAFCKSLNRMRILLVLAAVCFVIYGTLQDVASIVVWNTVTGGLNLSRFVTSVWGEARTELSAEEETLRRLLFPALAPGEFLKLWALGHDVCCVDEVLVEAGSVPEHLFLIVRGAVHIEHDGEVVEVLHAGTVIGQLDPYPFSSPSADWRAAGAVWLRSWSLNELAESDLPARVRQALAVRDPELARAEA